MVRYIDSVKLFISHCGFDHEVAELLNLKFSDIPGISCYLQAIDIYPGDDWQKRIKNAAKECDEIVLLMTPEYLKRPWFYSEWAIFWFQEKPWTLLILDATLEDAFEPMRKSHVAYLDNERSVETLLERLYAGTTPTRAPQLIAHDLVRYVTEARGRAAATAANDYLNLLADRFQNVGDITVALIKPLLLANRLSDIVAIATNRKYYSDVKRRQVAVILVTHGHSHAASEIVPEILNGAERKNIGVACLHRIKEVEGLPEGLDHPEDLLIEIYHRARDPQRRTLREEAGRLGLEIDWPDVEPNP